MSDFLAALGLVFVIEGVLHAAAPAGMKRLMAAAQAVPEATLRAGGLGAAIFGIVLVWLVRS